MKNLELQGGNAKQKYFEIYSNKETPPRSLLNRLTYLFKVKVCVLSMCPPPAAASWQRWGEVQKYSGGKICQQAVLSVIPPGLHFSYSSKLAIDN